MFMAIVADAYDKLNAFRAVPSKAGAIATKGAALVRFQAAQSALKAFAAQEDLMRCDKAAELPV